MNDIKIIDTAKISVFYALNPVDIKKHETYDDLQRLDIGNNYTKYYSLFVYNNDSLVADWIKKNPNAGSYPSILGESGKQGSWRDYIYSEYFRDLKNNIFTEYLRMPYGIMTNYTCDDSISDQKWEIKDDTMSVMGYKCQKAECEFRGRKYTAWFAPDVPLNFGPYKFGGLPGLILKLNENSNFINYECVGIKNLNQNILLIEGNYKKITREKLQKLISSIYKDYFKVTQITIQYKDGKEPEKETIYPMELK